MVAPEAVDHSENADTATEEVESTRVPEADSSQEEKTFYKFSFSFSIPSANARVFVGDEDMGTSFEVEEGSDVTFRIVARGYKVGALLFMGRPLQPNADGSYTVSNVRSNCSFTVMLAKAEGEGAEVTFRCTNAKVTVGDVDYTNGTYSHPGGLLQFTVEIPEGYYVQSVKATPDQNVICGAEMRDQKTWYGCELELNHDGNVIIDIVAAEGVEDTWPLAYQYTMNGPTMSYAIVQSCAPTYQGALEIPNEVIHNGVPFSVRSIGEYAFMECYTLTDLTMPDTIVEIGYMAFGYTGLRHIQVSKNLRSIGEECFTKCIYLEEITLPEGLTAIPKYVFDSCYSLRTVNLPDSLCAIGQNAFWDCYDLQEIKIPKRITVITHGMFMGCKGLEKVTFLGPVTSIEESAFYGTKSLKHIDLPESLTYLGGSAFALFFRDGEVRSGGLEEITIPASISKIEDSTFSGCCDLKSVSFLGPVTSIGNSAFYGTTSLQDINLPESVCTIGKFAFARTNFQKIRIPKACSEIKNEAFTLSALEAFEVDPENPFFQAGDDGVLYSRDGKRLVQYPYNKPAKAYVVQDGTQCIEEYAFSNTQNLEQVSFPESLREIGSYGFYRAKNLQRVDFAEGIDDISSDCTFAYCSALRELTLPSTLRDLSGEEIFAGIGIRTLVLPAGLREISGTQVFSGCQSLSDVKFPNGLKTISGDYNFANTAIEQAIFPDSLIEITGVCNFASCEKLTNVLLPEKLRVLGGGSFWACASLEEVNLPATLTELEGSVFRGCYSLKEIRIPEGVTNIGSYCFFNCEALETIAVPEGVEAIGVYCFAGCKKLKSIELPLGLKSIGDYAFACTGITELLIPKTVISVGDNIIGVKELDGQYAADGDSTYIIYFEGDIPEWNFSGPIPQMRNARCYFPKDNATWIEKLRELIDGPYFWKIHWIGVGISLPESLEMTASCQQQLSETIQPADDPNLVADLDQQR